MRTGLLLHQVALGAICSCDSAQSHTGQIDSVRVEEIQRTATGCFRVSWSDISATIWGPTIDSLGIVRADSLSVTSERPQLRRLTSEPQRRAGAMSFWQVDTTTGAVWWHFGDPLATFSLELQQTAVGYEGTAWQKSDIDEARSRVGGVNIRRVPCSG